MKNILLWLTAALIGILLAGCSSTPTNKMELKSSTSFTIKWDNTRDLTIKSSSVNSIVVTAFYNDKQPYVISNRPEVGNTTSVVFFDLPAVPIKFTVSLYSDVDGKGDLLSKGEQNYTQPLGMGLNQLTLVMHAVPFSLNALPYSLSFDINDQPKLVTISGYDNIEDSIIFNQGELEFSILDTSVATFEQINANQVKVTPKAVGTTTLRVKSTVPGVNVYTNVPITVTSMQIASKNISPTSFTFIGGTVNISTVITGSTPSKVEAEISGGIYSVPNLITLELIEGEYTGTWNAPSNLSIAGTSNIYTVKIKATSQNNQVIESSPVNVTVASPEQPPAPLN